VLECPLFGQDKQLWLATYSPYRAGLQVLTETLRDMLTDLLPGESAGLWAARRSQATQYELQQG